MADKKTPKLHAETEMFTYETPHGTIRLPYLENLPMGLIEDAVGKTAPEMLSEAVRVLMDDETTQIRREMTIQSFNKMIEAWNDQSAIKLGELFA